jgi:hypothetical protein
MRFFLQRVDSDNRVWDLKNETGDVLAEATERPQMTKDFNLVAVETGPGGRGLEFRIDVKELKFELVARAVADAVTYRLGSEAASVTVSAR